MASTAESYLAKAAEFRRLAGETSDEIINRLLNDSQRRTSRRQGTWRRTSLRRPLTDKGVVKGSQPLVSRCDF